MLLSVTGTGFPFNTFDSSILYSSLVKSMETEVTPGLLA